MFISQLKWATFVCCFLDNVLIQLVKYIADSSQPLSQPEKSRLMSKHNKLKYFTNNLNNTIVFVWFLLLHIRHGSILYSPYCESFFNFIFLSQNQALSALDVNCKCFTAPDGLPFFDCNWFLHRDMVKTVTVDAFLMRVLGQSPVLGIDDIFAAFRSYFSSRRLLQDYTVK
jgi:hypothetical protein